MRPQIYLFFVLLLLAACSGKKERPDTSHIQLDLKIERFDQDLARLKPDSLEVQVPQLINAYGVFYEDFVNGMLGIGSANDPAHLELLRQVIASSDFKALQQAVAEKYPDLNKQEEELADAFKLIKYYYPQQQFPRMISFFSGFAVQIPIGNNYMGIGLDMFLGRDSKFYPALVQSIPQYISRRFEPQYIVPRVVETFTREEMFPERDADRSFLSKMVYNGQILYFMKQVMPEQPDSVILGLNSDQLEWAEQFEADIWGYYLENNLLYETDYLKMQKYLSEAPFTPGLGQKNESAPKLGLFTGLKIVEAYMERNPQVSLQELMQESDAQKILEGSKYKPK